MKTLNVLIGAGFSYDAGLPLGNGIAKLFTRDNRQKLMRRYSSEWAWVDNKTDSDIHNGRIYRDVWAYEYVLNELAQAYEKLNGCLENYEDFFQFVLDLKRKREDFSEIVLAARKTYLKDSPELSENKKHLDVFEQCQASTMIEILNYLIADVLKPQFSIDILVEKYSAFLDLLRQFETATIFTLNHDTLIEDLLQFCDLDYSDGFSRDGCELRFKDRYQRCFDGQLKNTGIRLVKLHGSIDLYRYDHLREVKTGVLTAENSFTYYKPDNYAAKHKLVKVDKDGKVLQDYHSDVVPKFVTGTRKKELIINDPMYKWGMNLLQEELSKASTIFICGYSFGDDHINEILNKAKGTDYDRVINVNPISYFPIKLGEVERFESLRDFEKNNNLT